MLNDLRFAVRLLLKGPGFAAGAARVMRADSMIALSHNV
jgi:hypothetical protein